METVLFKHLYRLFLMMIDSFNYHLNTSVRIFMKTSEFSLNCAHNKVHIIMIYYAFSQKLCNILLKDTLVQ